MRSLHIESMVQVRQIAGECWRELRSPALTLRGKAKKLCVSKKMLKIYVGCFIALVRSYVLIMNL